MKIIFDAQCMKHPLKNDIRCAVTWEMAWSVRLKLIFGENWHEACTWKWYSMRNGMKRVHGNDRRCKMARCFHMKMIFDAKWHKSFSCAGIMPTRTEYYFKRTFLAIVHRNSFSSGCLMPFRIEYHFHAVISCCWWISFSCHCASNIIFKRKLRAISHRISFSWKWCSMQNGMTLPNENDIRFEMA